MTEYTELQELDPTIPAKEQAEEWTAGKDPVLQGLVAMANKQTLGCRLTLLMGGLLVSGELVSAKEYFEGLQEIWEAGMTEQPGQPPGEALGPYSKVVELYASINKRKEGEPDRLRDFPAHVHLRNARFFHPGGRPIRTNKRVWWRGRLEAVDGFTVGSLSAD